MNMSDVFYEKETPPRIQQPSLVSFAVYFVGICIAIWSFKGSGWSIEKLLGSSSYLIRFLNEAFPTLDKHHLSTNDFLRYLDAMVETFQIAFTGTIVGILLGFGFALFSSRGLLGTGPLHKFNYLVSKFLISLFRTIPDLVWAIIFVMVVGLGAFAGTLTISVDTIGFCGRFFAEEMEDVDKSPSEAIESTGASKLDSVFAAVIPAAMPGLITTSLFAFEKAIRSSVVLGLVGAGGIGLELQSLMNWMAYDRAMVIIFMIFALVMAVEQLSSYARRKVIEND